jgi:hypothetical protein
LTLDLALQIGLRLALVLVLARVVLLLRLTHDGLLWLEHRGRQEER